MINLTVRTKKKLVEQIDVIAKMKHLDRAQIIRQILETGIETEKINLAIELYQKGETVERAANLAEISIWDLLDAIKERGLKLHVDMAHEKVMFSNYFEKTNPELSKRILKM
jgi:predicted HTH domain antitoxin